MDVEVVGCDVVVTKGKKPNSKFSENKRFWRSVNGLCFSIYSLPGIQVSTYCKRWDESKAPKK